MEFRQWPSCGGVTPGQLIRQVQQLQDLTARMSETNRRQAASIYDLQQRVTALENGGGGGGDVTVVAYDWNGSGYDVPASPPSDSIVLRITTGPEPYDGEPWPDVRDLYFVTEEGA